MNIEFSKTFEKQIDAVLDKKLRKEISDIVRVVLKSASLNEIPNLKKLKGYKTAFSIRTGNYRIGFVFHNNTVYFLAFAHRKDIYKSFPG